MKNFTESSSWIRKMFEKGKELKRQFGKENVFDFSLGNPDLPVPEKFIDELKKYAENPKTKSAHGYMPNPGYPQARKSVAEKISEEQNYEISYESVIMTCGAAGALNVSLKSLLNPGDEVILIKPFFVEYQFYVDNHGGIAKFADFDEDFNINFESLKKLLSKKTKALIINSPNNPTGQIYSEKTLEKLADILKNHENKINRPIVLISDEPYRNIVFDDYQIPSLFKLYSNTIIVSSYSKSLSLAGERIGYIAVNPKISSFSQLLTAMTLANRIIGFVNAPAIMQNIIVKLQNCSVNTELYDKRRKLLAEILSEAGFEFKMPKGTFYFFPKTPIQNDMDFVKHLQNYNILAVPGSGFGASGYIRLAFCVDTQTIKNSKPAFIKAVKTLK